MSGFGYYAERARRAAAQVAELERALGGEPDNRALKLNLASARKFFERSDEEFRQAAALAQYDVLRYRLVQREGSFYALRDLSRSWASFQDVVSYVYDALTTGPRSGGRLPLALRDQTTLGFAYSYPGSLGVVLTVPNDQNLFSGRLDEVVPTIEELLGVGRTSEVREVARKVGRSAIQRVYEWSSSNYKAGFDLDLGWSASKVRDRAQYVSNATFGAITEAIEMTSDSVTTSGLVRGTLVGFNSSRLTFHFVEPDGESFVGQLGPNFPASEEWAVNRSYAALIETETTVRLATGQETTVHRLLRLNELSA